MQMKLYDSYAHRNNKPVLETSFLTIRVGSHYDFIIVSDPQNGIRIKCPERSMQISPISTNEVIITNETMEE